MARLSHTAGATAVRAASVSGCYGSAAGSTKFSRFAHAGAQQQLQDGRDPHPGPGGRTLLDRRPSAGGSRSRTSKFRPEVGLPGSTLQVRGAS